MDQLRVRLGQLVGVETHPVRIMEHRTFNRLMYRNRNQHRHGFYFRKLEEVRRILRKIQGHVAWASIRNAVDSKITKKRKSLTAIPLALSSVTHGDLMSLKILYNHLVGTVIPSAAEKVTVELVGRSHFLPFAVTMLSILARLHVLEKNIFKQLQGAIVEVELLLFVQTSSPEEQNLPNSNSGEDRNNEDLGTEIDSSQGSRVEQKSSGVFAIELKTMPVNSSLPKNLDTTKTSFAPVPSKRRKLCSETENVQISESKSLYERISTSAYAIPMNVTFANRAAVSTPQLSSVQRDAATSKVTNEEQTHFKHNQSGKENDLVAHPINRCVSLQREHPDAIRSERFDAECTMRGNKASITRPEVLADENTIHKIHTAPVPEVDSSDSEDLDDIFGVLED
ncbi:unnamed protein product [Agarophyton chilense]